MRLKRIAAGLAGWLVPPRIRDLLDWRPGPPPLSGPEHRVLSANADLAGRHAGERCFVLATGPSIRRTDLTGLADEVCIATSDFYRHEAYTRIAPAYYCLAPIHPPFDVANAEHRLGRISATGVEAEMLLPLADRRAGVAAERFFGADRIRYVHCAPIAPLTESVDLAEPLPIPTSVALLATWIAMGMGFTEICLVGCDHGTLWQWDGSPSHQVEHFFDGDPSIGAEPFDVDAALRAHLSLRDQYRWTRELADRLRIRLINANPDSFIDILPRLPLSKCLAPVPAAAAAQGASW